MKIAIPSFKPCAFFVEKGIRLNCLRGAGQNSSIPGLAELERKQHKKDPQFDIFLRGKEVIAISSWQSEMLRRLFEQGELASGIKEGFAEFEKRQHKADLELEREFWEDVKANRLLRHLVLLTVVVDEIKKRVFLSLRTDSEGNLDEHGICIVLRNGRWRFHYADDFAYYLMDIQSKVAAKIWKQLYPAPSAKTPVEADPQFLFGTWEFDKAAAQSLGKRFGKPKEVIQSDIENYEAYRLEIAPHVFNLTTSPWSSFKGKFVGVQKRGDRVSIAYRIYADGEREGTMEFVHEDGRLMNAEGLVLKKAVVFDPNAGAGLEEDTAFIFGRWELDPTQTEALLRHRGVSETRLKVALGNWAAFSFEVFNGKYDVTIADARRGKMSFRFPFEACSKRGHVITVNEQETYYHQGNLLAQITPSLVIVYRKTGTVDDEQLDCEAVCKLFSDVRTKPGL